MCYYFSKSKSVANAGEMLSSHAAASEENNDEMSRKEREEEQFEREAGAGNDEPERKCA